MPPSWVRLTAASSRIAPEAPNLEELPPAELRSLRAPSTSFRAAGSSPGATGSQPLSQDVARHPSSRTASSRADRAGLTQDMSNLPSSRTAGSSSIRTVPSHSMPPSRGQTAASRAVSKASELEMPMRSADTLGSRISADSMDSGHFAKEFMKKMNSGSQSSQGSYTPQGSMASNIRRPMVSMANVLEALRDQGPVLRVASLNLGGRNTNPFEFVSEGDASSIAQRSRRLRRRAQEAMRAAELGPAKLRAEEGESVDRILGELFAGAQDSEGLAYIKELLGRKNWASVYNAVKSRRPGIFNALNLPSLMQGRPSLFEDPESCREFSTSVEYLAAWLAWHRRIKETNFWLEEVPEKAAKKGLDAATAFAGLLVFDLMCVCCAKGLAEESHPLSLIHI